jgi:hypothetical protein
MPRIRQSWRYSCGVSSPLINNGTFRMYQAQSYAVISRTRILLFKALRYMFFPARRLGWWIPNGGYQCRVVRSDTVSEYSQPSISFNRLLASERTTIFRKQRLVSVIPVGERLLLSLLGLLKDCIFLTWELAFYLRNRLWSRREIA